MYQLQVEIALFGSVSGIEDCAKFAMPVRFERIITGIENQKFCHL